MAGAAILGAVDVIGAPVHAALDEEAELPAVDEAGCATPESVSCRIPSDGASRI